jgi:hypothetical protein
MRKLTTITAAVVEAALWSALSGALLFLVLYKF